LVAGSEKKDGIKVSRLENWIRMMLMIGIKTTERGMNPLVAGEQGEHELGTEYVQFDASEP